MSTQRLRISVYPVNDHIYLRYIRYLQVQDLVEEGKITDYFVNTPNQLADLGTKHLRKLCHRAISKLINDIKTWFIINGSL